MDKVVLHLPMASVGVLDAIGLFKGKCTGKLRFRHMPGGSYEEEQLSWSVVSHLGSRPIASRVMHASKLHNRTHFFNTVSPCTL